MRPNSPPKILHPYQPMIAWLQRWLCNRLETHIGKVFAWFMAKTEIYRVNVPENQQLADQLNFIFNQMSNRLDRFEAIRGSLDIPIDRISPQPMYQVREVYGSNTGAVTIVVGVLEEIIELDCGACEAGDRIWVSATAQYTKGGTDGRSILRLDNTQNAAIGFFNNWYAEFLPGSDFVQLASSNNRMTLFGIAEVTNSTNITLLLRGDTYNSDVTVGSGEARIHAVVIRPG